VIMSLAFVFGLSCFLGATALALAMASRRGTSRAILVLVAIAAAIGAVAGAIPGAWLLLMCAIGHACREPTTVAAVLALAAAGIACGVALASAGAAALVRHRVPRIGARGAAAGAFSFIGMGLGLATIALGSGRDSEWLIVLPVIVATSLVGFVLPR